MLVDVAGEYPPIHIVDDLLKGCPQLQFFIAKIRNWTMTGRRSRPD